MIDLGAGDDTFFGGRGGINHQIRGGDGNDKMFGPDYVRNPSNDDGTAAMFGEAGNDLIDLGDYNNVQTASGGAGNDKIIGGQHYVSQNLYGDAGDDKIWSINPELRGQEITASTGTAMYGGAGNDHMYGNDQDETLIGDDGEAVAGTGPLDAILDYGTLADYYNEDEAGDDVIFGYGGTDWIFGMKGDDILDGGS